MDEKVFLAVATTEVSLSKVQVEALADHGWQAMPHTLERSPQSLLFRQVQSEDDAAGQYANLIKDVRLSDLDGLLQTPVFYEPAYVTRQRLDPPKTDSAAGKPAQSAEEPQKEAAPRTDTFPAIPEYLWKSLKPDNQDELAKKLVEYAINRPDTAAYGSSFDDAALFAHLEAGERSGLAKRVLEQKHGMTLEQVKRETLANEFQTERVNLMKQAVATTAEINEHLKKWRELSDKVLPLLIPSSIVAGVFVLASGVLVLVGRISGWELAVLAFVFSIMAVSPATLLLIGRPLKGLDEWSPNKQEKKADEPAADKGKSDTKTAK